MMAQVKTIRADILDWRLLVVSGVFCDLYGRMLIQFLYLVERMMGVFGIPFTKQDRIGSHCF